MFNFTLLIYLYNVVVESINLQIDGLTMSIYRTASSAKVSSKHITEDYSCKLFRPKEKKIEKSTPNNGIQPTPSSFGKKTLAACQIKVVIKSKIPPGAARSHRSANSKGTHT